MGMIKFRGWSLTQRMFVYGHYITDQGIPKIYINRLEEVYGYVQDWVRISPESLGQFSGLLDSNGIEIFEGDIIEIFVPSQIRGDKKIISIAQYKDMHGCPNCHACSEYTGYGICIPDLNMEDMENIEGSYYKIIGNKFENSNLLKEI